MAFVQAMMNDVTKVGVNGADVYTEKGVGNYLVTLFTMLVRGLNERTIDEHVRELFLNHTLEDQRDLFVMAFQTRDVRGGKGERKLFYQFLQSLYRHDKETTAKMLHLVPEYGCWRDMWEIVRLVPELESEVLSIVASVFVEDKQKWKEDKKHTMSLLTKWIPREGSGTYPGMARTLANELYPTEKSERKRLVMYRKDVSAMNKVLKTVEIDMCGKTWAHISPQAVPGRCLKIHKKAFLNLPKAGGKADGEEKLRYPDEKDRKECREHFLAFIEDLKNGKKKAHGAHVVMPHELVATCISHGTSKEELDINQGQWVSILEKTLEGGGLRRSVPMCDFSGSMSGLPKLISLALGILISEVNHDSFKDHILTFDSNPSWHSFAGRTTLKEKVDSISRQLGQGLSTNFFGACMSILERMKKHRVPVGEEPEDLIVLTDMGFDDACVASNDTWSTQLTLIQDAFHRVGEEVWGVGTGWKPPRIVIWNLRAEYNDFHAKADQEGVIQLSGWSPSVLKVLQTTGVQIETPDQGLRAILDDSRYDPVRAIWNALHVPPPS